MKFSLIMPVDDAFVHAEQEPDTVVDKFAMKVVNRHK